MNGRAFLERSRRGKRHAAQEGRVGIAPYGYRYINKQEGGGEARFEVVFDEARLVQQVYRWVGRDRCTINEVCRRLHQAGIRTRTGKEYWDHKTIWDMLKNPAYKGEAAFGKTRWVPNGPRLRGPRGKPAQPRRPFWGKDTPKKEWITIPVPALVDPALFDAVQDQLEENRRRARIPEKGTRYLLQGLLVCAKCGYAYHGCTNDERNAYYRCSGSMSLPRFGGKRRCWNKELRIDQTDTAVWQEVCQLLEEPEQLEQEYRQRLQPPSKPDEQEGLDTQMGKLRRGIARLIESYAEGFIDKQEFEPRVTRMRERLRHLEEQLLHLKEEARGEEELRLILGCLETFAAKVKEGLYHADFQTRREIVRALVKRVKIDEQQIRLVFRISPLSPTPSFDVASPNLQHWGRREHAGAFHRDMGYLVATQPVIQGQQICGHGPKGAHKSTNRTIRVGQEHTSHNRFFVDVQTTTARIENVHLRCSFLGRLREVRGNHQFRLRAHRPLGATVIHTGTHQDQLPHRAFCIKMPRSRLIGSPASYAIFSSASLSGTDIALPNAEKPYVEEGISQLRNPPKYELKHVWASA